MSRHPACTLARQYRVTHPIDLAHLVVDLIHAEHSIPHHDLTAKKLIDDNYADWKALIERSPLRDRLRRERALLRAWATERGYSWRGSLIEDDDRPATQGDPT